MGENSAIEWTDATVNFWWGCTKVGPGCDNCYAEKWSRRTGGDHWGVGVPRRKIKGAVALMHRLDNGYSNWAADHEAASGNARAFGFPQPSWGRRRRVFVQSMSDLFDLEVPVEWFAEAWKTIKACDRIDIQIVTKRISAVRKRLAEIGETEWPRHAGLLISVVNQPEADRDVPRLLDLKAALDIPWVGLSMEPLLGAVDLRAVHWRDGDDDVYFDALAGGHSRLDSLGKAASVDGPVWGMLDWVIAGGESGPGARPMHPDWARALRDQCKAGGVPFFFKQWGEWLPTDDWYEGKPDDQPVHDWYENHPVSLPLRRWNGMEWTEGGNDDGPLMARIGKKTAGRHLDGREHNDTPKGGDHG